MGSHFVHIKFYQRLMWTEWDPIKYYFYCTLIVVLSWPEDGRSRPKHVAKYHLILIIASCLMYVVYWRCTTYYTNLITQNGMVSLSLFKKNQFLMDNWVWPTCKYLNFEPQQSECPILRLTLNPLTWKIRWAPNNASRWQMGLNSAFRGLTKYVS